MHLLVKCNRCDATIEKDHLDHERCPICNYHRLTELGERSTILNKSNKTIRVSL